MSKNLLILNWCGGPLPKNFMPAKESLIKDLIREGYIKTPSLAEAFEKIDRADFVPENLKSQAYFNHPLPIGFGQTISQPLTVAFMLELLEPKPDEKILEVGAGSGWVSALLAYMVGEKGKIISIERIPEICELARKNIAKYGFLEKGTVELVCADASRGFHREAPFDRITAAAAGKEIPPAWKEELKIGGRLVMPVANDIIVLDKKGPNDFEEKKFFGFSFVPLVKE